MNTFVKIRQVACFMLISLLFFKTSAGLTAPSPNETQSDKQTLVFLNWSEYVDPELVKAFEAKFDVTLKEVYFETDEMRDQKLAFTMGKGYDLALVSGITVAQYAKRNWIAPLDAAKIPNVRHIAPRWRNAFPDTENYAIPYTWGTLGIAYRKDQVPEKITHWKQFFRPSKGLRGKIMVTKDSNDTIGMALKALGYSINSTNMEELAQAETLLLSQKPFVKEYSYISTLETSGLVTGDIHMAMAYNGDAVALQEHDENITYVVPDEGTNIWVDYVAVMQSSEKKDLAYAFVNFLNEPENSAKLAMFLNYATPNASAEKFLPPEFMKDPIIHPSEEILSRSEFFKKLPPRVKKKRNSIFSNVLSK